MYRPANLNQTSYIYDQLIKFYDVVLFIFSCCGLFRRKQEIKFKDFVLQIIKEIAEGGFSYVYLCKSKTDNKFYAAKKILIQTPEQKLAVNWELQVLRSIKGPSLLPLIDYKFSQHESNPNYSYLYMIFPYIERGTLLNVVQSLKTTGRRLNECDILKIFKSICQGISVLHNHNPPQAHRDIKLSNILLDYDNKPFIMDFGSVSKAQVEIKSRKEAVELQEQADVHCTNPYRAPELFDCPSQIKLDERTDIQSLGCLLYSMAFGNSPFDQDESGGSVALAVSSGKYSIPENSKYTKKFLKLVNQLLSSNINDRPFIDEVIKCI